MNIEKFSKIILFMVIFKFIASNYPEDYSTIEQLTNPENKDNSNLDEVFLGAYFYTQDSTAEPIEDKRNGIKIYSQTFSSSITYIGSYTSSELTSINDDGEWTYTTNNNPFYPPTSELTRDCIKLPNYSTFIDLDLSNLIASKDIAGYYSLNYSFYFWIEKTDSLSRTINIICKDNPGNTISFTYPSKKGIYQFYLKYNFNGQSFYKDENDQDTTFNCPSMKLSISGEEINIKRIKVSELVSNKELIKINCNDVIDRKCPYSYYCESKSGNCKKCLGKFSQCQSKNFGLSCGRFTKDAECNPDYFNLQKMGKMSFDITPPIKSNAASLSFWFFSLANMTYDDNNDDEDTTIYHISLEDFFVVTIIPGKAKYKIYLTAYQMYHEAYSYDIQTYKTKNEFMKAIESFPCKNWYINEEVGKMNRWIYVLATFNKNKPRIGIKIASNKRDELSQNFIFRSKEDLPGEYVYKNENAQSKLHYKKFYRNSDVMHLNVNIFTNTIGNFIRNIYVFATELIINLPPDPDNLSGFQYIEYEKLSTSSNSLMPELILAIPFDTIEENNLVEGQFLIQYYMYDMTKINNNKLTKLSVVNPGDIIESLYDYDPRLYRLNLALPNNKKYLDSLLIDEDDISCNNDDYCYSDYSVYASSNNCAIDPINHNCITNYVSYTEPKILVPGINADINKIGTLTDVCYGNENSNECTKDSLTEHTCSINSYKLFDACITGAYFDKDVLGYFY